MGWSSDCLARAWSRITEWIAREPRPADLGHRGEQAARRFLKRQGLIVVASRDRNRYGEIDLVAVDGETVVFVEVKTRSSARAGHPAESVDADKQARLSRAALRYLKRHDLLNNCARFDVVAVHWPPGRKRPKLEHIRNAFQPTGIQSFYS